MTCVLELCKKVPAPPKRERGGEADALPGNRFSDPAGIGPGRRAGKKVCLADGAATRTLALGSLRGMLPPMPLPRRLRSFSLRTLMVLVAFAAILAAWLASERRLVKERMDYRAKLQLEGKIFGTAAAKSGGFTAPPEVRWSRRLFGDESIQFIMTTNGPEDRAWHAEAQQLFPEAKFLAVHARPKTMSSAPTP